MKVSIRSLLRSHTVPSGDAFASVVAPAKWRTVVCVGAFAGVLLSQGAAAAEPAASSADDTGLAEITVTAEKYTSTIQNTPISMSAMSGAQLTAAGISNIEDVARDIPGLHAIRGTRAHGIRGAGTRIERRRGPDRGFLSR